MYPKAACFVNEANGDDRELSTSTSSWSQLVLAWFLNSEFLLIGQSSLVMTHGSFTVVIGQAESLVLKKSTPDGIFIGTEYPGRAPDFCSNRNHDQE